MKYSDQKEIITKVSMDTGYSEKTIHKVIYNMWESVREELANPENNKGILITNFVKFGTDSYIIRKWIQLGYKVKRLKQILKIYEKEEKK